MIELDGLTVQVGRFHLREVSLRVPTGGYALVIGPTGSGKTTLLEAIAGHVKVRAGRVLLHGQDVATTPPEERGLGFVYQQYHLFPHLSVRDNIAYGLANGRADRPAERAARADELADALGLTHLLDRGIHDLSGGEQQRVALARALAPRPRILLLDEPFASVDPTTRHLLRREVRQLHDSEGITTLQVTHDFDEALRLGDLVAVLADGRIAQSGTPEQVFRYPNSAFVAQFVGTGNVLGGRIVRTDENGRERARTDEVQFAARFICEPLELDVVAEREGPAHAVIRPEDIVVSRMELPSSARNQMAATIVRLERVGPVTQVHLDVGRPLVAAVTSASADEMQLAPGASVTIAFKATAIHLL
ncbi:MAG TPA: ABC transporter ATP-binding protein [Gemmatimonadales bacterium]|nr:ABC transporter ATP-binding protein [Gemmatimonadales bacterium]